MIEKPTKPADESAPLDPASTKQLLEEGRELRRLVEKRIDAMRVVSEEQRKARTR